MIGNLITVQEDFQSLKAFYNNTDSHLQWNLVFTLPGWLEAWWQNFGSGAELYIRSIRQNEQILGIAPLQIRNGTASIIGNTDVCDYQDFILVPGMENEFYNALLDDLHQKGIRDLHLETIRPDSSIVNYLMPLAQQRGYGIDYHQSDVTSEIDMPDNWDNYLKSLDGKQRHEIKRKIRNLERVGDFAYREITDKNALASTLDHFLKLFPESRDDKAEFMTPEMQKYFRSLVDSLQELRIIKFGSLEIAGLTVAMVMYFDYQDNRYLYNSAYDPNYRALSVGIISKAMCIRDSIQKSKNKFDFLKGAEQYKYYLGGKEIPLYSCHITI